MPDVAFLPGVGSYLLGRLAVSCREEGPIDVDRRYVVLHHHEAKPDRLTSPNLTDLGVEPGGKRRRRIER